MSIAIAANKNLVVLFKDAEAPTFRSGELDFLYSFREDTLLFDMLRLHQARSVFLTHNRQDLYNDYRRDMVDFKRYVGAGSWDAIKHADDAWETIHRHYIAATQKVHRDWIEAQKAALIPHALPADGSDAYRIRHRHALVYDTSASIRMIRALLDDHAKMIEGTKWARDPNDALVTLFTDTFLRDMKGTELDFLKTQILRDEATNALAAREKQRLPQSVVNARHVAGTMPLKLVR